MANTEHDQIENPVEPNAAPQPPDEDIDPAAAAFTRLASLIHGDAVGRLPARA